MFSLIQLSLFLFQMFQTVKHITFSYDKDCDYSAIVEDLKYIVKNLGTEKFDSQKLHSCDINIERPEFLDLTQEENNNNAAFAWRNGKKYLILDDKAIMSSIGFDKSWKSPSK